MGHRTGEKRKGDDRGVNRPRTGNAKIGRGTRTPLRTRAGDEKVAGGRVIPLSRGARGDAATRTPRRGSSTGGERKTLGHRRLRMVAAVFLVSGLLLGGRAVHISLTDDQRYQAFATEQDVADVSTSSTPVRGSIVSADGRELATSLEASRVIATPYQISDPDGTAKALAGVLGPETGQDADEIRASLTSLDANGKPAGYSVVAVDVTPETAQAVQDLGLAGISTAPDSVRVYPDGSLASQLTGYRGDYGEAFGGVEERYDERLQGGEDVTLTLDSAVQQELQKALAAAVEKHRAKSAVGLVMRADDGAIVALANAPGYDNNRFGEAPAEAQRNRALTDPYEPGSTFKAFTVAAALEEGAVTPASTFVVPDHMAVADHVIHDSQPHATEVMAPGDVLRKSSNVGAIQVAQSLGGEKLHDYIKAFGFGDLSGVDLWGEDAGIVPAYEDWSGVSIGNIPIGQGLTVTPLQLVSGYATIANGGHRVIPHVTEQETPAEPGPRVISEETSAIVRGMLQGVVDEGSGHYAQISGYTVAGKTGTSQKVDPEIGTYGDEYVASFIGFAPASDPEYVTLIAVDEPETSYWGELVAVPAFHEVMSFTLGYFNVPPDREPSDPASGEGSR
jgi:cell division protein FtsI/penicillin-binding protein 2